jgi:hypothetical protein
VCADWARRIAPTRRSVRSKRLGRLFWALPMGYEIRFANGKRLRGESLADARRCIHAARSLDQARLLFPASIWKTPSHHVKRPDGHDGERRVRVFIDTSGPVELHELAP